MLRVKDDRRGFNRFIVKKFQLLVDDKLELIAYIEFMQTLIAIELQDSSLLYTEGGYRKF
jgi:hypothetical protein